MLNKNNRIGNKKVIEKLFRKGNLFKTEFLIFKYDKVENLPQFAVSVSKKNHKKATKRNRLRRQIYEVLRMNLPNLKNNIIALVIARPTTADHKMSFQDFNQCVKTFFNTVK